MRRDELPEAGMGICDFCGLEGKVIEAANGKFMCWNCLAESSVREEC